MDYEKERQELCRWCRNAYWRDLVYASDGNFSMRVGADRILITPSGRNKGFLAPEDLLLARLDGTVLSGGTVSREFPMHRYIYTQRPEVAAVFHAHPVFATALASSALGLPDNYFVEVPLFLGQVPVAPFAAPGTPEIVEAIRPHVDSTKNLLIKNHGVVVYDTSLEAAFNRLEILESACRTFAWTELLGRPSVISPEEMARLRNSAKRRKNV